MISVGTWMCLALVAGLSTAPPAKETSRTGRYRVTFRARVWPLPVNEWHAWDIQLERVNGQPLQLRHAAVEGKMPAHGHGLPSAPQLKAGPTPHTLVVEGVRFNMPGNWELHFLMADDEGADVAVTHFDVGPLPRTSATTTWSPEEREVLKTFSLSSLKQAPDASNAVADNPRAVSLGHQLFFDKGLSHNKTLSCAECHDPAKHFTDGRRTAQGAAQGQRNTPSLVGTGNASWWFWDGRSDSLWSQALGPMEAPGEMNATRLEVVRHVATHYASAYRALFGPLPQLKGLPPTASPVVEGEVQTQWAKIPIAQQHDINRAFANIGKAIAAYERQLRPGRTAFDNYVDAILQDKPAEADAAMAPMAVAGLKLFLSDQAQCTRCHNGPLFTNGGFHNIGTGTPEGEQPDFGRSIGLHAVLSSEFNCRGVFNDDPLHACTELDFLNRHDQDGLLVGAYKVPTLRGAAVTGPYMHDGRFSTLEDVIAHYQRPVGATQAMEFRPLFDWTSSHVAALAAFLRSLTAPVDAPEPLLHAPWRVKTRTPVAAKTRLPGAD